MWVNIDFCLIPLGEGVSISPFIAICQKIIEQSGLNYELGPSGTSIEGDWSDVFECVKACHEALHEDGVLRIYTMIKVNTRIDKKQSFRDKVPTVKSLINK